MKEVIELLEEELAWTKNTLSNLSVSLNDATNKVGKIKEWIADAEEKATNLETAIILLTGHPSK